MPQPIAALCGARRREKGDSTALRQNATSEDRRIHSRAAQQRLRKSPDGTPGNGHIRRRARPQAKSRAPLPKYRQQKTRQRRVFCFHHPCFRPGPAARKWCTNYLAASLAASTAAPAALAASAAASAAALAASAAASAAGAAASAAGAAGAAASAAGAAGASAAGAGASTAGAAGAAGASSFLPQAARAAAAITVARTRDFFMTVFLLRMSCLVCRTGWSSCGPLHLGATHMPARGTHAQACTVSTRAPDGRFTGFAHFFNYFLPTR